MQQMHQGQIPGPPNPTENSFGGRGSGAPPKPQAASPGENATTLDDLVSGAAKEADKTQNNSANGNVEIKVEGPADEKKGKKDKDKNTKLVYSDNNVSPEEKMANLPRYAFAPKEQEVGA